jgi:hypothetical protein
MQNVQARGFIGESFIDKVLWDLWVKRQYDPMGYVEGVLDLATVDTPDGIKKSMGIDLDGKIEEIKKELGYFEGKRAGHNPLMKRNVEAIDEIKVQMRGAREIEHALVNAYFNAGFLFRREEFRQRSF